jgi:hypothetical protein
MATHADVARFALSKKNGVPLALPPVSPTPPTVSPVAQYNVQQAQQAAMDAAFVAPSFTGSQRVTVGDLRWGMPPKSETVTRGDMVYVRTPNGEIHVLVARAGQVREFIGSPAMQTALARKVEALFTRKRIQNLGQPVHL